MVKEDTTVMLMSLKCGGVGLNLTRANRKLKPTCHEKAHNFMARVGVISLDLSWSSAIETQSFDRAR
jgi:hypothetical protein